MTQTPPDGERFEFTTDLRHGGWAGVTESSLVVETDARYRVHADQIQEVTFEDVDWFVGILGLVVVGYGLYSVQFDVLFGLAFAAVGLASLYLTYRKRNRVQIRVAGRPKPLTIYPPSTESFQRALDPLLTQRENWSEP